MATNAIKTANVKVVAHVADKSSIICKWNDQDYLRVRVSGTKPVIDSNIAITYKTSKESGCPKNASFHATKIQETSLVEVAPTVEDWEAEGGIILNPGETVFVKGRETYKVSRARQGDGIFCNCAAWKFQKLHPLRRTCKHCEAVCGKQNEALRIAMATVKLLSAPTPSNTRRPITPAVSAA